MQKTFYDYVNNFEREHGFELKREDVPWGREGEVDCCFKLSELTAEEQEKFIADIRALLHESKLVYTKENTPCKNKH